ncbi:hypothetical protein DV735_g5934, partial [Chaetothyriales sp. CBS 134920]
MSCVIDSNRTFTLLDCADSGLSISSNILGIATFAVAVILTYFAFFQDIRDIPTAADDYSNEIRSMQNQLWALSDIHGQLASLVADGGIRLSDVHLQSRLKQGTAGESLKEAHKFLDDYSQAYQSVFTDYFKKHRWFVRIRWLSLQKRVEHFKVRTSVLRERLTLDLLAISVNLNFAMNSELRARDVQLESMEDKLDRLISETLAQLQYEKKNQALTRLNRATHTISRRPLQHAPIASPLAGADVPKVVYVSAKTPLMAAVKRVRKFLVQIEKRATQDVRLVDRGEREGMRRLAEARDRMMANKHEVLVKARGITAKAAFEDGDTTMELLGAAREQEAAATAASTAVTDNADTSMAEAGDQSQITTCQQHAPKIKTKTALMGVDEQKEEREVLESIFPDEITDLSDTSYRVSIRLDVPNEAGGDEDPTDPPVILLNVSYPESYPEVAPHLDLSSPSNAAKHPFLDVASDKAALLEGLQPTIEESLGMAMIFTLVTTLKESAEQLIIDRQQAKEKRPNSDYEPAHINKFETTATPREYGGAGS